ncbi:MAG: multicopper oxidase domain-containing protein [Acidobacteriota bacterium]
MVQTLGRRDPRLSGPSPTRLGALAPKLLAFAALAAVTHGSLWAEGQSRAPFRQLQSVDVGRQVYVLTAQQTVEPDPTNSSRLLYQYRYNNQFPGEKIEVAPGETMVIDLVNRLEGLTTEVLQMLNPPVLRPSEFQETKDLVTASSNITNLHTHGLHVSPGGRSDNVMIMVPSGKQSRYRIKLGEDHAPGTHWYHAHLHGSTALQVQGGMVGALVVEPSTPDQSLNPPGFRVQENVMILQLGSGWTLNEAPPPAQAGAFGSSLSGANTLDPEEVEIPPALVNGVEDSALGMQQDVTVQRLRVINAGSRRDDFKSLWIRDSQGGSLPMYLAAMDGINLTELPQNGAGDYIAYTEDNPLVLAAGNRADIFFLPEDAGTFTLTMEAEIGLQEATAAPSGGRPGNAASLGGGAGQPKAAAQRLTFQRPLITFEVGGPDLSEQLLETSGAATLTDAFLQALDANLQRLQQEIPAYSSGYLRPFSDSSTYIPRNIRFNTVRGAGAGRNSFLINDRSYNRPPATSGTTPAHEMMDHSTMGGHEHMGGHSDYLGKMSGDGGLGPQGQTPWPLRTGTEEEWVITNESNLPHPFHIHVSPFWIMEIEESSNPFPNSECSNTNGLVPVDPLDPRINRWQDTVILPPCGTVRVRHRVSRFDGIYVLHCHILQHEDRGMMMNVLTIPNQARDPQSVFDKIMENNSGINRKINAGP